MTASSDSVEAQLEREERGRRTAIIGAVAAVALQVAGEVLGQATALPRSAAPGTALELPRVLHASAATFLAATALLALGFIAMIAPLDYLYLATKRRREQLPAFARITVYAGPILLALGLVALQVIRQVQTTDYLVHHQGDYFAARRIGTYGAAVPASVVVELGLVTTVFALVIVPLNAMRVGLLTRFMGVLGIIVAVLMVVVPQGASILRWFWLGALVYLFAGRWPGGTPPAWRTGRAEPWPTARELRERRAAADRAAEPDAPEGAERRPHPRSRKRRGRKRR